MKERSNVADQAQTRRRTSATGSRTMPHSVNAIALAAWPWCRRGATPRGTTVTIASQLTQQ